MMHNITIKKNPQIDYVGFNIESGKIVSEKVYYKKDKGETLNIENGFVKKMLLSVKGLRFFSEESASLKNGIVKYDFQVDDVLTWLKAMIFLNMNAPYYDKKIVVTLSQISWLRKMFTTVGIRLLHDEIQDIELYYRRIPRKKAKLCRTLSKLLNANSANECEKLMHLFFSNGGWVRLAAIDFQADHQYFKIYFETENSNLVYKIADGVKDTVNYKPLCNIIEYCELSDIFFCGMAIAMDIKSENIRYNLYYRQKS